jgi:hypothetical protein
MGRTISNDWVIRHNGLYLQLQPGNRRYGPTKSKALVCEWEDGTIQVYYRGERIAFTELLEPKPQPTQTAPAPARVQLVRKANKDHPWRRGYQNINLGFQTGGTLDHSLGCALPLRPKEQGSASVHIPTKTTTTTTKTSTLKKGTFLTS